MNRSLSLLWHHAYCSSTDAVRCHALLGPLYHLLHRFPASVLRKFLPCLRALIVSSSNRQRLLTLPRLFTLQGLHDNTKSYGEIAWLLLQVFFGSAFLGFEQADEISKLFGAPLMVLFVAISVLMLYTLLISIFSQTFSEVCADIWRS